MKDLRADFPLLTRHPEIVYLDSACTSLKPQAVLEAERAYYTDFGACAARSSHSLGRQASEQVEKAREQVSGFVGARSHELVWTRNATEALNLVAFGLDYSERRQVVTTEMEHHSVLLPLLRLREEGRIELEILTADSEGRVPFACWQSAIGRSTALVVTHGLSNVTGTGQPVSELAKLAHDAGALLCVDGAQGVPHQKTDVGRDKIDFLCFSAHKMLGPNGIGALVAPSSQQSRLRPLLAGGGTARSVSLPKVEQAAGASRFEAGIQHYAGMLGFAAACAYLRRLGMDEVERRGRELGIQLDEAILAAGGTVYGPSPCLSGLRTFNLPGAKPHNLGLLLDQRHIAVRSGYFCAQPALNALGAGGGAVRASTYVYTSDRDISRFGDELLRLAPLYS